MDTLWTGLKQLLVIGITGLCIFLVMFFLHLLFFAGEAGVSAWWASRKEQEEDDAS